MNSKNRKTLEAVFSRPTPANIKWADLESLLASVGATVKQGDGSRVRFTKGEMVLTAHKPHPNKEAGKYQIADVRQFLEALGVKP